VRTPSWKSIPSLPSSTRKRTCQNPSFSETRTACSGLRRPLNIRSTATDLLAVVGGGPPRDHAAQSPSPKQTPSNSHLHRLHPLLLHRLVNHGPLLRTPRIISSLPPPTTRARPPTVCPAATAHSQTPSRATSSSS
jgi:hypothetical protein